MIEIDERAVVDILQAGIAGLEVVYLFGSAVDDLGPAPGDIDIAVLPRAPLDALRRWELQQELARRLHMDVDLVDLRSASTVLRVEVVAHGRVLLEADPAVRESFEATVLAAYARLNESRRELLRDAIARGRIYA